MDGLRSPAEFKRLARVGREAGAGIALASVGMRAIDERSRRATFIFSDESIDREGDRIMASGWDVRDFMRNPVALFSHDARSLPIGRAMNLRINGPRLIGDIVFAPADVSEFADRVFKMVKGGFVQAVSVGFAPIDWRWARETDRLGSVDFIRQTLLEISVVTIPANQQALLIGAEAETALQRGQGARRRKVDLIRLRHDPSL